MALPCLNPPARRVARSEPPKKNIDDRQPAIVQLQPFEKNPVLDLGVDPRSEPSDTLHGRQLYERPGQETAE